MDDSVEGAARGRGVTLKKNADHLEDSGLSADKIQHVILGNVVTSTTDTIYGGTNQIQRNIIGERALGLPREPRG